MTTRVVVVEDDARYRASLKQLFQHVDGFDLVAGYGSPHAAIEALELAQTTRRGPDWDLILMDLQLPGMSGIDATRAIKKLLPDVSVVVITVFEEPATVLEAICAGVDGYMLKKTPPKELVEQLRVVIGGGAPLTAGVARTVLSLLRQSGGPVMASVEQPSRLDLTEREQEILRCLVDGMAYKQIAGHLDISIDTVRSHIRHIYRKLQVHSVAEAVSRAVREGLV